MLWSGLLATLIDLPLWCPAVRWLDDLFLGRFVVVRYKQLWTATPKPLGPNSRTGQHLVRSLWGCAPKAVGGTARLRATWAGPQKLWAGRCATAVGLGNRSRWGYCPKRSPWRGATETAVGLCPKSYGGQGSVGLLWGWGPKANGGAALCDPCGAAAQKPMGAAGPATTFELGTRSRWGHGPLRPVWGRALETDRGTAPCDRRRARP